jgi:hypothetical protein
VPKRDLVASVQAALQSGTLKFAADLPLAPTLIQEMLNFRVTISDAGHDSYSAWRENQHDDLVLATMLAAWWAQRPTPKPTQQSYTMSSFGWEVTI